MARALLLATLVNSPVFVALAQESIEPPEPAPVDTEEIQAFRDALAGIESGQGPYAQALSEQLLSLGQVNQGDIIAVIKSEVGIADDLKVTGIGQCSG